MFLRALIAEDSQGYNLATRVTLDELNIPREFRYNCDDAMLALRKGASAGEPFDLLITDLGFEKEKGAAPFLKDGKSLMMAARELYPELKILVFSVENRPHFIQALFSDLGINGFVSKGLSDVDKLKEAIKAIWKNGEYRPIELRQVNKQGGNFQPTEFDKVLLNLLQSHTQKNIPFTLKAMNVKPCSLSSVEKRISFLKERLGCPHTPQLLLLCKERGYI